MTQTNDYLEIIQTKEINTSSLNIKPSISKEEKHHSAMMPLIGDDIIKVKNHLINKFQNQRYKRVNTALRNFTIFMLNINIGLRIGDLVNLKISDVMDESSNMYDATKILEGKTDKERTITFTPEIKKLLFGYINLMKNWKYDWYLFYSLIDTKRNPFNPYKHLSERSVCKMMENIGKELNLSAISGTHALRKTYARAYFDANNDNPFAIELLQKDMGHSSPRITREYIGIEMADQITTRLNVGTIGL